MKNEQKSHFNISLVQSIQKSL